MDGYRRARSGEITIGIRINLERRVWRKFLKRFRVDPRWFETDSGKMTSIFDSRSVSKTQEKAQGSNDIENDSRRNISEEIRGSSMVEISSRSGRCRKSVKQNWVLPRKVHQDSEQ